MTKTEELMFQNVAYRPTVYKTGVSTKNAQHIFWSNNKVPQIVLHKILVYTILEIIHMWNSYAHGLNGHFMAFFYTFSWTIKYVPYF